MNIRNEVSIIKIKHMATYAVDKCGIKCIKSFFSAQDGCLTRSGNWPEGINRNFHGLMATAADCNANIVNKCPGCLPFNIGWQIIIFCFESILRQYSCCIFTVFKSSSLLRCRRKYCVSRQSHCSDSGCARF